MSTVTSESAFCTRACLTDDYRISGSDHSRSNNVPSGLVESQKESTRHNEYGRKNEWQIYRIIKNYNFFFNSTFVRK